MPITQPTTVVLKPSELAPLSSRHAEFRAQFEQLLSQRHVYHGAAFC